MTQAPKQRLGSASIAISIDDVQGFVVRHGETLETLFSLPPEKCSRKIWARLFAAIEDIVARPNA